MCSSITVKKYKGTGCFQPKRLAAIKVQFITVTRAWWERVHLQPIIKEQGYRNVSYPLVEPLFKKIALVALHQKNNAN